MTPHVMRHAPQAAVWACALAFAPLCGVGCAARAPSGSPAEISPRPAGVASRPGDAATIFALARSAVADGDRDRGEALYRELIETTPDEALLPLARYNLGLLLEARQAWREAATEYGAIIATARPAGGEAYATWRDAHYRLGACAAKIPEWSTAAASFLAVLDEPGLDIVDRLEAMVGAGIALNASGGEQAGRLMLEDVVRLVRSEQRRGRFDDRGFGAEAAFRLGELAHTDYAAIELAMPETELASTLEEKCQRLLDAQRYYVDAIRLGDAHTAAAAGLRIGALYEELYDALTALAAPSDFDAEQASVYAEVVAERLDVLLRKARHVYERALDVGSRDPRAAPWTDKLRQALARLEALASSRSSQLKDSTAGVLTPATRIVQ